MPNNSDSLSTTPDSPSMKREPLAVIGIGCRLPGGINSAGDYWDALLRGINAIREVPGDRWKHHRFHDTNAGKAGIIRNARGGFIDGVDLFDGEFFGYFPAEAQRMDPQQRLLLEVTHEAMEDAGLRRDQLDGTRTSVFVGAFMYDYLCIQAASEHRDEISPYVAMGCAVSPLANRISYDFNLTGPSVSLDTACSSSLVAVHLACRSLWNGEADMAIAGGVNLMLRPESSIMLSKAGFLNPDQYCKAFDASANGYVRGEGSGVVILKPLSKAISDGDSIYALVRGSGVNQDGYLPEGFTVPNVFSQIALLEAVYAEAGIDPLKVDYVEAHGTGTPVGDPIESLAIGAVLGRDREEGQRCLIGSVKTNLGHLEGAAGIAGFIKATLTAHHGVVPPNLHFREPNPEIDWEHLKLEVPVNATLLERNGRRFTVGVNSFGAGGTNAHVVLEEPVFPVEATSSSPTPDDALTDTRPYLYQLSSVHRESLKSLALKHATYLENTSKRLDDIAFSAFARRSRYSQMLAVVGESHHEIATKLRAFAEGKVDSTILSRKVTRKKRPRLAFAFSGQGGQWLGMGLQLMQHEPVFRQALQDVDRRFQRLAGWSLLNELQKGGSESRINDTVVVQPAIMAIQLGLVKLYEHYGIRPAGVVGHSIGEVAAAHAAGALTIDQAVQVIYHRSQAQNLASGRGGMLAVGMSHEDVRKIIDIYDGRVSVGAVNGPEMVTLSGDSGPLEQIAQLLESRGVFNRPVKVQVAYHSHHMDPIKDVMLKSLAEVQGAKARIPLYSTVTGHRENGLHLNSEYWFQNVRQPVLFTTAASAMLSDGFDTFIEIGPHPVLVSGTEALLQKREFDGLIAPSMTRKEPEITVFLQSLSLLTSRGIEPKSEALFGTGRRYVRLPLNPWQHQRHWFENPAATELRQGRFEHPFLKRRTQLVTDEGLAVWEAAIDPQKFPYLRDHRVDGEIVFPATGHVELAWAVASEQFRHETFVLEDLHFDLPLILSDSSRHPPEVRLEIVSSDGDYRICSRPVDATGESSWTKHSSGRINTLPARLDDSAETFASLRQRFDERTTIPIEPFYSTIAGVGLIYGETFRCIHELHHRDHEILARLQLPDALVHESSRIALHPALFDACLHAVFADVHQHGDPERVFLPYRIERIRIFRQPTREIWSHVQVTRNDDEFLCSDILIYSDDGELVAELSGLTGKRLIGAGSRQTDTVFEGCFEYRWESVPRDVANHERIVDCTTALIWADAGPIASKLASWLSAEHIQVHLIRNSDARDLGQILDDIPLDRRTMIVFASGMEQPRQIDGESEQENELAWRGLSEYSAVPKLLQLAQELHKRGGVPRLVIVTNGAAGLSHDPAVDLGQSILHGMARVINNECPNVPRLVIDTSRAVTSDEMKGLFHELMNCRHDQDETEVALRGTDRFVRKLVPIDRESAEQVATTTEAGVGGDYRVDLSIPGALDQITFRRQRPMELGPEDVEILVEAASLNFKDVMNAMGLLQPNAVAGGLTGQRLGLEVAGRVVRVGTDVGDLQAGDEVIARVAEGFCGRVITPSQYVFRKPSHLTVEQAAAIPLVYITAWYSLCHLARMAPGETVLIHSAAGGVGLAAIRLAQRTGARVIATAGTREKREYLKKLGIEHVFDSRSLDFANDVLAATEGRGVDIVLNSLTGRFIAQSMKCLVPFGRFVEIGKSDIYRNSRLGMEQFGENISYFVVDVDRLALQKPELHWHVMAEVVGLFDRREVPPPEVTVFPISHFAEAIRFMSRGVYCDKIVVSMQGEQVQTLPPRHIEFRSNRSYLITGGASGFGLEIAKWMVSRGARNLMLLSRSGCKRPEDLAAVNAMREVGAKVEMVCADITNADEMTRLVKRIQTESPPLAGIIHGAAVLEDASLSTMDMARFARVFQPKAQGAWNLHTATVDCDVELDFFVLLSSISSVLGLFGQLNYSTANFFQDSLAQHRRLQGLPATSINLGVLGDYAGMSRTENDTHDIVGLLENQGLLVMTLPDVLSKLEAALLQQPVQRMTARFDWARFRSSYPHLVRDSRFIDLMSDASLARGNRVRKSNLRATLSEMEPSQRRERLQHELALSLARILDANPEKIDVTASIDQLGLDSLMLTDFQIGIVRTLDVNVPLIKLLKGPSLASLTTDLLEQLESGGSTGGETSQSASQAPTNFTLADLEGVRVLSPWLIRGQCNSNAPVRLICFHSMGVGASLFTRFLLNPPEDYDILAVQTPGRENRQLEPVADSMESLVSQIVPELVPLFDRPVVVWGHSFGGIVAWEVLRQLRDRHRCEPIHFVVTGTEAPHMVPMWQKREIMQKAMIPDNSPEYLLSRSRFVDDPVFFKTIIVPGMRRDMPLLQSYRFRSCPPLKCPMTAFAARQDDMVYTDLIREWSSYSAGGFELIEVDGDHWFLDRNRDLIIATFQEIAAGHTLSRSGHDLGSAVSSSTQEKLGHQQ